MKGFDTAAACSGVVEADSGKVNRADGSTKASVWEESVTTTARRGTICQLLKIMIKRNCNELKSIIIRGLVLSFDQGKREDAG